MAELKKENVIEQVDLAKATLEERIAVLAKNPALFYMGINAMYPTIDGRNRNNNK